MATMTKSKSGKQTPDYPMHAHCSGQWAAKINGTTHCFEDWSNPEPTLTKYSTDYAALKASRQPRQANTDQVTVREVANAGRR